jgi:uncharacterized metal-binding protein
LKLSLPRDGVRGCSAPCNSILYVRSFFKNGTDLTVFVILQVIYACLLLQKDAIILMSVGIVVLTLRIEQSNVLEGVFASYIVLKLQGTKLETHHSFHLFTS